MGVAGKVNGRKAELLVDAGAGDQAAGVVELDRAGAGGPDPGGHLALRAGRLPRPTRPSTLDFFTGLMTGADLTGPLIQGCKFLMASINGFII